MDENELMVVGCPSCNQRFRVRHQSAGRAVRCPHCSQAVNVPLSGETDRSQQGPTQGQERFRVEPESGQVAAAVPQPGPAQSPAQSPTTAQPVFDPGSLGQPAQQVQPQPQLQAAPTQPLEQNPFQPSAVDIGPSSIGGLPARRRYPALQIIRTFYLAMAVLVAIGWALYMVGSLILAARVGALSEWFWVSLIVTGWCALGATLLVSVAEIIKLAIDVQSNTLSSARSLANRS